MADIWQARKMLELFSGTATAHGEFYPGAVEGKKQTGKSVTVRTPVDEKLWISHLNGDIGLGIVPINEQSLCKWGVIDIDDYNLDFVELLQKINSTPLVCCYSKSGGAHLFIFSKDFIAARAIKEYLLNTVSILGFSGSEIFPKQEFIKSERGDIGNWLNMPYFGLSRFCIRLDGNKIIELTLEQFIIYSENKSVNSSFFTDKNRIDYEKSPIENGPPCLQIMSINGFPSHTRNTSLFNLGIYARKATPDEWQLIVRQFNKRFFNPSLSDKEVDTVIRSLDKKTYGYQCHEEPLCSFCNAKLCRTRKYGISGIASMPIINSITKVVGDVSMWFIDVEGGRLELTTEELFDNKRFSLKCLNDLNILPLPIKNDKWVTFIQSMLDRAIEIKDESMFTKHEIPVHFEQFIGNRLSKEKDDVFNGRVWYDEGANEIWFKSEAFFSYLRFRKYTPHRATLLMYFRNRGVRNSFGKTKDRKTFRFAAIVPTEEEKMIVVARLHQEELL